MRKLSVLCALSLLLAGCANSRLAILKNEKINPEFKGGAGQKALIIVATADPAGRENLENQFAIEGVAKGVTIVPSYRYIPKFADITREAVEELVKTNGFDRVIIARGVPKSLKTGEHSEVRDYYSVIGSGLVGYPGLYDYWGQTGMVTVFSPTDPPPSMTVYGQLKVATAMYDATNASLIWSALAEITTSAYQGDAAKDYVKDVVGHLKGSSLL